MMADCPPQHNHMSEGVYANCPACGTVLPCLHVWEYGDGVRVCRGCGTAERASAEVVTPPDHPSA